MFADSRPWGAILFDRNIRSRAQLTDLCSEIRDVLGFATPIFIDQEGGRVARLRPPEFRDWLPPLDHVRRAGASARRAMWLRYRLIAAELRGVGIDANCAPCADVARDETHPFLRNRCYGDDAASVADLSRAVADGLLAGGVLPVLKHIPGHGAARADSHLDLPVVSDPELEALDFAPFAALSDLPMAMTAHVVYPTLDPDLPATLSPSVIETIRRRIGFSGLLMTDDISMGALDGPIGERCRSALDAGCDVILHCNGNLDEMRQVAMASGDLGSSARSRADAALAARRAPQPADETALEAELHEILAGADV